MKIVIVIHLSKKKLRWIYLGYAVLELSKLLGY